MPRKLSMSSADLDASDLEAVTEVVRSGHLALGPYTEKLETALALRLGVAHAVAVNSGTSALHLIVKALRIGPGDEVLVPSFTFAASVNVILYENAIPVFVDVEPETLNLCLRDLERKITPRTRAIMAVDVFGHPAEWDGILDLARRHGLRVIDDSCEALGAEYRGKPLGGFGDAAAFAFYPNKQITTGEGGALVTDDAGIAELARSLRNQGRSAMGTWLSHEFLGYNYRMDQMSAALGVSQLRRLDTFLERREAVARLYTTALAGLDAVEAPRVLSHVRMSWFVYVARLAEGLDRDPVMTDMESQGVPVRGYFAPVHLQPYIRQRFGDLRGTLAVTEAAARRAVALPFHNRLNEEEVERVVRALAEAVGRAHVAG